MVVVDFSNPFLRVYLARQYSVSHRDRLCGVAAAAAQCAEHSRGLDSFALGGAAPRQLVATVDIDEVLLANIHTSTGGPIPMSGIPYDCSSLANDFFASDYYTTPDGSRWPRGDTRLNPMLPGAPVMLNAMAGAGMRLVLITGRAESLRAETVENFVYAGLASDDGKKAPFVTRDLLDPSAGRLIMCPDEELPAVGESIGPFKEKKRKEISEKFRISMNVGDQLSDLGHYADFNFLIENIFYRTA